MTRDPAVPRTVEGTAGSAGRHDRRTPGVARSTARHHQHMPHVRRGSIGTAHERSPTGLLLGRASDHLGRASLGRNLVGTVTFRAMPRGRTHHRTRRIRVRHGYPFGAIINQHQPVAAHRRWWSLSAFWGRVPRMPSDNDTVGIRGAVLPLVPTCLLMLSSPRSLSRQGARVCRRSQVVDVVVSQPSARGSAESRPVGTASASRRVAGASNARSTPVW